MITFSNLTKLITLIWSMIILSTEYCKADNDDLNCLMTSPEKDTSKRFLAVNKCAYRHENREIIEKCHFLINRKYPLDLELLQPVTDDITNAVYFNKYCAHCNNYNINRAPTFQQWKIYWPNEFDTCHKLQDRIQRSEIDDIYNLIQIFTTAGVKLVTKRFDETQLECSLNGKWPFPLIKHVIPCLRENLEIGFRTRLKQCQYAEKTGRMCTKMEFYIDGSFLTLQNGKVIDLRDTLYEYKNFTPEQYYQGTSYPGLFFVCDLPGTIYGGLRSVKILIVVISLISIIITLGINSNKRYLKPNTNKLLYLYMVGLILIILILLLIYISYSVPCVAFYLAQFLWVYHFFWSMLIFIEFCLLAFCTLQNRIVNDIPFIEIRYLIYCIFGFIIPFALPIIYYFGVLVLNENYKEDLSQFPFSNYHENYKEDLSQLPFSNYQYRKDLEYTCPIIPNHSGVLCTSYEHFGSKYYEDWLKIFLLPSFYFFMPVLFLFIFGVVLYYFFKYRSDDMKSIPYKDHLIVLTKMAIIMGIHWLLFIIYSSHGKDHSIRILGLSLDTICQLFIDFHGIIVFVVFGAQVCIPNILNMFGCEYKSVAQQDRNNEVEIS